MQVGDIVYLTGDVYTARDKAHQRIIEYTITDAEEEIPIERGAVLYHCGPLVLSIDARGQSRYDHIHEEAEREV